MIFDVCLFLIIILLFFPSLNINFFDGIYNVFFYSSFTKLRFI